MSAPTQWITGDGDSDDYFNMYVRNYRTLSLALYYNGYIVQDRTEPTVAHRYNLSTYPRCVRLFTYDRDSGGSYTPRAIFVLPKLVETTSWLAMNATMLGALISHFALSVSGAGVLAVYVTFYRWRFTGIYVPTIPHHPHSYPYESDSQTLAVATDVRWAAN